MKSFRKELLFVIPEQHGLINITEQVQDALASSGIQEGLCLVNAMHITASVFINDDDKNLYLDFEEWLDRLAPNDPENPYHLSHTGELNADSHLKRSVIGREVIVAITDGKLDLGTWEQILYYEFDGRRKKNVLIKIIGE